MTLEDLGIPEVTDMDIAKSRARAECFNRGCLRRIEDGRHCKATDECKRVERLRSAAARPAD